MFIENRIKKVRVRNEQIRGQIIFNEISKEIIGLSNLGKITISPKGGKKKFKSKRIKPFHKN